MALACQWMRDRGLANNRHAVLSGKQTEQPNAGNAVEQSWCDIP